MKITVIAFVALALMCGAIAQNGKSTTPQNKGNVPALATCEKYFRIVTECINTKVPQDKRAEKRQELDYMRTTLSNAFSYSMTNEANTRDMANATCQAWIHDEMQQDTYGCYAKQAAAAGIKSPCSFITPAELQEILKSPVKEGERDEYKCFYAASGSGKRSASIEVHWTAGRDELEAARKSISMMTKRAAKDAPDLSTGDIKSLVDGQTVPGLADDAFFTTTGPMRYLYVRKGEASFTVEAYGATTREQMVAVAQKILPRFP